MNGRRLHRLTSKLKSLSVGPFVEAGMGKLLSKSWQDNGAATEIDVSVCCVTIRTVADYWIAITSLGVVGVEFCPHRPKRFGRLEHQLSSEAGVGNCELVRRGNGQKNVVCIRRTVGGR